MKGDQLQIVSFGQAKALKALGFDWKTEGYYTSGGKFSKLIFRSGFGLIFSAPTVALALKWMRDVNVIAGHIIRSSAKGDNDYYTFCFQRKGSNTIIWLDKFYDTYEEAESALLDAAIEELEKERD